MTDEYKAFLESRTEGLKETPKWKPPEKTQANEDQSVPLPDSLSHYGIPHMRWGYRRFQYKNGTLTPEGKIRYGKGGGEKQSGDGDDSEGKSKGSGERSYNSKTSTYKKSDADKLTDEELNRRTNRLQREKQYKDLLPQTKSERRKEIARKIFVEASSKAAASVVTEVTRNTLKKMFAMANKDNRRGS